MDYFSHSEVPSLCLRDVQRTKFFRDAIFRAVKPGDVVLDLGSGSGILALFAAQAGARKVCAVEVDQSLCERLQFNVVANGFGDVIEVVCADVRELSLPYAADVVIAEMIETWLLDELQLPAINTLRKKGLIKPDTQLIPMTYEAFIEFGHVDLSFLGYQHPFPIHDWPDLAEDSGWQLMDFQRATDRLNVFHVDFAHEAKIDSEKTLSFVAAKSMEVNAVRLSGPASLVDGLTVGATNVFNGDKIIPIPAVNLSGAS